MKVHMYDRTGFVNRSPGLVRTRPCSSLGRPSCGWRRCPCACWWCNAWPRSSFPTAARSVHAARDPLPLLARAFRGFSRGCDLCDLCDLLLLLLAPCRELARVDGGLGARHLGQRACTLQPAPQPAPQPEPAPQPARAPQPAPASRAHALLAQHATEHAPGRIETSAHAPPASPFPCSCSDSGRPRCRRPRDPHGRW